MANQYTLNTTYAVAAYTLRLFAGIMVHRPDHNGTHLARQVRFLEAMFDLIESKGLPEAKEQLQALETKRLT